MHRSFFPSFHLKLQFTVALSGRWIGGWGKKKRKMSRCLGFPSSFQMEGKVGESARLKWEQGKGEDSITFPAEEINDKAVLSDLWLRLKCRIWRSNDEKCHFRREELISWVVHKGGIWFSMFEVRFSLSYTSTGFIYHWFPSCGWNNWGLEELTNATELLNYFVLILHFEYLFHKICFWITDVFFTLFNNVHCKKK